MDKAGLESLLYLLLLFLPLLYLPRFLQREIQSIFLLITRQPEISMVLFSLLFLPGVFLHETSHFLMARLLNVKTGRFSLIPKKLENGRLQLGYVETASTDFVRDAIIGAAPLFIGSLVIDLIGVSRLEFNALWGSLAQGQANSFRMAVKSILRPRLSWRAAPWRSPTSWCIASNGFFPIVNKGEMAVLYCWIFFVNAAQGPGIWSADAARAKS